MGNIIGAERRGYKIYLRDQLNGYLELVYSTPFQAERVVGIYEEQHLSFALDEFHTIAPVVTA